MRAETKAHIGFRVNKPPENSKASKGGNNFDRCDVQSVKGGRRRVAKPRDFGQATTEKFAGIQLIPMREVVLNKCNNFTRKYRR